MDKQKTDEEISWLGARLREPSTYAGLAILLGGIFHLSNADGWAAAITSIGLGVGGIIAIVLPEAKKVAVVTKVAPLNPDTPLSERIMER